MDKSFFPYGNKSKEFLLKRTIYLCKYLELEGANKIILACNTLSILVLNDIKKLFKIPIIGVIELFDFVNNKNSLFIGSNNTIKELKRKNIDINLYDGTEIIEAIEKKENYQELIEKEKDTFNKYPSVLLGCTHLIEAKYLFKSYESQDELYLKTIGNQND